MQTLNWHNLAIKDTLVKLKSSNQGLRQIDIEKRIEKHGLNVLPEEKRLTTVAIFLNQFRSPLIYILLAAAILSFLLKENVDGWVILAAVIINTIVGFLQENKANKAISKLNKLVTYKVKVVRDDKEREIDSKNLVPGDIIVIEAGDKVPADARLIENNGLKIVEAALTGESVPSMKRTKLVAADTPLADRENMIYMGTSVASGDGRAVVVFTGEETELGKIATLVKEVKEEKTPLQNNIARFSRQLGIIILFICFLIIVVGLVQRYYYSADLTFRHFEEVFVQMFSTAVAIAVSAIPEGLLVSVTIILAIGMQRILRKNALVRKLIAAETLGSISVICSDKTGTLTEGKMKAAYLIDFADEFKLPDREFDKVIKNKTAVDVQAFEIGMLCNNVVIENPDVDYKDWKLIGDPTEQALYMAGVVANVDRVSLSRDRKRIATLPFIEEQMYMATFHQMGTHDKTFVAIKGASERLLEMSKYYLKKDGPVQLTQEKKKELKNLYESLSKRGLRVMAVGYKEVSRGRLGNMDELDLRDSLQDITLVGFFGLQDPLRPESKDTIVVCREAGIKPIIITGDHRLTALAIGRDVGLSVIRECVLEGRELDKMSDEDLRKAVGRINIYARVEPRHKLRIISALQKKGEVVAMTGDGVNDAPALKSADVGVALGSGTDVAKEASDIVLLDNNFKTIVSAIREGRIIFENIRKIIVYLLSDSFSEMILIIASLIFGWPLAILPVQILWINLITDGFPNIALTVEPGEQTVMNDKPRPKKTRLLNREMKILIFVIGIFTDLILLGLFYYLWKSTNDITYTRTVIFAALGTDSLFYVFSCRSFRRSILHINPFQNRYLLLAVLGGFVLQLLALYLPFLQRVLHLTTIGFKEWGLIIALGIINIIAIEFVKYIFIVKQRKA